MREKDVERKLVRAARDSGGMALKFVSPGMAGVPDRLVQLPGVIPLRHIPDLVRQFRETPVRLRGTVDQ